MFSFVANQVGYKDWNKYYKEPMKELSDKVSAGFKLSSNDLQIKANLELDNIRRNEFLKMFDNIDTVQEAEDIISNYNSFINTRTTEEIFDAII